MEETIYTHEDLLTMLDALLKEQSKFNWDHFYANRDKPVPFFVNAPDENLAQYFKDHLLPQGGKALDLGCGPGRNAIFLARQGYEVDAVDMSSEALRWGTERAHEQGVYVNFINENLFGLDIQPATYDLIYDSGCLHHIAPHRRIDYVNLIVNSLKPGGFFGLTCFVENGAYGGTVMSDWEVYRQRSLKGGMGFNPDKLKMIFKDLQALEIRKMKDMEQPHALFGVSGLWTALFQKCGS